MSRSPTTPSRRKAERAPSPPPHPDLRTIFEKSRPGRRGVIPPRPDPSAPALEEWIPAHLLRTEPVGLPELSEPEVVRHYTKVSTLNASVDSHFYPLGSCTMKHNPRVNEAAAALVGLRRLHPYQDPAELQGALELLCRLEGLLAAISGLPHVTLQPAAGAHGELTALLMIRAYQLEHHPEKNVVLVPDSAHGTNPASCAMAGFEVVEVESSSEGTVDLEDFHAKLTPRVAALMITNPNTLGIFEKGILEITTALRARDAFTYLDGANLNALLGIVRPADCGVDVMHFNLHKTFSTPHGGGGPGAGPVAVAERLEPYLPRPRIRKQGDGYSWDEERPKSIGKVKGFFGNFGILVRAYAYIRAHGPADLRRVSECAVLNANYLRARLAAHYDLAFPTAPLHEVIFSARRQRKLGVRALDIAKRLLDLGFHPPTIYFPIVVPEALMIEPTETETQDTLDRFADAMVGIARDCEQDPERIRSAPATTPVGRLDEVRAVKEPLLVWPRER